MTDPPAEAAAKIATLLVEISIEARLFTGRPVMRTAIDVLMARMNVSFQLLGTLKFSLMVGVGISFSPLRKGYLSMISLKRVSMCES